MLDKIKNTSNLVEKMDEQMRTSLLKTDGIIDEKKLWENTYIKHQIDKRKNGGAFSVEEHICAMVYSMLSSGISWKRVEDGIDISTGKILPIDEVFCQYDISQIMQFEPEHLRDKVKVLHCASQSTLKQMYALLEVNIPKLVGFEKEHKSIDGYYQRYIENDATLKSLVRALSDSKSEDKMAQMDVALVCEYLRNVGYDIPKPDRHIRRILGKDILGCSDKKIVPVYEVFDIVTSIASESKKSIAEVDYILWSYCANGYGEVCMMKHPKCSICVAKDYCEKSSKMEEKP